MGRALVDSMWLSGIEVALPDKYPSDWTGAVHFDDSGVYRPEPLTSRQRQAVNLTFSTLRV